MLHYIILFSKSWSILSVISREVHLARREEKETIRLRQKRMRTLGIFISFVLEILNRETHDDAIRGLCDPRIGNKVSKIYRQITRTYPAPHCGKCNLASGWICLPRSRIMKVCRAHNRGNAYVRG